MDRNAIQQNRDPIGYTKRTRRYPPIKRVESSDECSPQAGAAQVRNFIPSQTQRNKIQNPAEAAEDAFLLYLAKIEQSCNKLRLSAYQPTKNLIDAVCAPSLLTDEKFMTANSEPVRISWNFFELSEL